MINKPYKLAIYSFCFTLFLSNCDSFCCKKHVSELSEKSRVPSVNFTTSPIALSFIEYHGGERKTTLRMLLGFDFCFYREGIDIRAKRSGDSMQTKGDGWYAPTQVALGLIENEWYLYVDDYQRPNFCTDWIKIKNAPQSTIQFAMDFLLEQFYKVRREECLKETSLYSKDILNSEIFLSVRKYVLAYFNLEEKDFPQGYIPEKYWTHTQCTVWGEEGNYHVSEPKLPSNRPLDVVPFENTDEVRTTSPQMSNALIEIFDRK